MNHPSACRVVRHGQDSEIKQGGHGQMGITEILTVIFVILKLLGKIDWS